jgi:hypothetical protein
MVRPSRGRRPDAGFLAKKVKNRVNAGYVEMAKTASAMDLWLGCSVWTARCGYTATPRMGSQPTARDHPGDNSLWRIRLAAGHNGFTPLQDK